MENIGGFGRGGFGNGGGRHLYREIQEKRMEREIGDSIENFSPYNKIYAFGVLF